MVTGIDEREAGQWIGVENRVAVEAEVGRGIDQEVEASSDLPISIIITTTIVIANEQKFTCIVHPIHHHKHKWATILSLTLDKRY